MPNLSKKRAEALHKSGIHSPEDLFMLFPIRYIDKTQIRSIASLSGSGETTTVVGRVQSIHEIGYGRKKRLEVILEDDSGTLKGVWFRGSSYFKKLFKEKMPVSFFGTVKLYGHTLSMAHPEVETLETTGETRNLQRIVPVYPGNKQMSKAFITHKLIHTWVNYTLEKKQSTEFIPPDLLNKYQLPERNSAFRMMHNPENLSEPPKAMKRFKYEELLLFEMSMARIKQVYLDPKPGPRFEISGGKTSRFFNELLPFELTNGQKSALSEIKQDLRSGNQMHRLVQGDVGSGKTIVAIGAMLLALDNGYQTVFMAPTEILAEQHYHTLSNFLKNLNVKIRLLTGRQKSRLRTDILTSIEAGHCDIIVGTHAVIQEKVRFHKLGLAVVDEQHRFGVKQRADILAKGEAPHLLVMSATPIPRSLAMSLYSDLDISVVKGLPAGRMPVKTAIRTERKRNEIYRFVEKNISEGGQVYVVFPLVDESETMDLKDATLGYEKLKKRFPDAAVGLLHGQMKSDEKEAIMTRFHLGEIDILISTTVIEVGVDVPNANVMIIEHAERFGLSQLHQLRGRIGRGKRQSYCILLPGERITETGRIRLNKMVETDDGFEIAEADLKLRGPGDFLGTKQSGLPDFRYADIVEDQDILRNAKRDAWHLIQSDPKLKLEKHENLKRVFQPYFKERSEYFGLG